MNVRVTELIWPEGLDELETSGCVAYDPDLRRDPRRLRKEVEIVDALIVRNQTRVDDALLGSGASLKAIGRLGVGLDNIDLAATRNRGISVIYARNANAVSVSRGRSGRYLKQPLVLFRPGSRKPRLSTTAGTHMLRGWTQG
jgi:D-3-phosphoglycerate dehydrogenase